MCLLLAVPQVAGFAISWAPLMPFGPWFNPHVEVFGGRCLTFQNQSSWVLVSPLFYRLSSYFFRRACRHEPEPAWHRAGWQALGSEEQQERVAAAVAVLESGVSSQRADRDSYHAGLDRDGGWWVVNDSTTIDRD